MHCTLNAGSRYELFDLDFTFDVDRLRITCTFLNTARINVLRSCAVMFGLGKDLSSCKNLTQSLRSEQRAGNTSRISVDLPITSIYPTSNYTDMCVVVRASDERHTAEVERMLTVSSGDKLFINSHYL